MADGQQVQGVDYAFPPWPNINQLAAAGIKFACRYGGPGTAPKHLTLAEAQQLTAAGIAVVANAEGSADGLINGFAAGVSWARLAEEHFRACGMPPGRPIYFSVDFDTTSGDWDELDAAMDGAASVIGRDRVGVYGEYSIIEHFAANQKARWYWGTYAWSGGRWSAHNHIEQYRNGVALAGADVDLNRALKSDYGQWTIGDDMGWEEKPAGGGGYTYGAITLGSNLAIWKAVGLLEAMAPKLGLDPAELAAITAAAKAGAEAGALAAADDIVAAIVAELPEGATLTKAEVQTAAEAAVRKVLGSVDGVSP